MLIAGELQITVPQVSFNDIDNFIRETAELHHASKMSLEEKAYMQRNNREYPWDRRLLEYEGKTFHNYKELQWLYPELYLNLQISYNL